MNFVYHNVKSLPRLAWCASVEKGTGEVHVYHGLWLETSKDFFVEGVWDGAFEEGNFDSAYLMGTGAKIINNKVIFSTPYHSHERLHLFYTETGLVISPSLAFLLTHTGQKLNVNYIPYQAKLMKMMFGVNDHIGSIPLASGATIEIVHFRNIEIDYKLHIRISDKKSSPAFESFKVYRKHLANTFKMIMDNAASGHRKFSYDCITTISSGYDSTTCSALAAEAGCNQAVTFKTARPQNEQSIGDDDSGVKIGEILGLKVGEYDRNYYLGKEGCPEAEFVSSGDLGQDLELCAFEKALEQKIVIMGDHGDYMWNRYRQKKYLYTKLYRNDAGGDCLIDFRWRVGFFPVRPAFFGALSHPSLHKISNSKDMAAWSTGNNYDRPIARRIAEEKGVPRYLFGQKKKAASVLLNSDERLKKLMKPESFKSFIDYYAQQKKHRNKLKQGFYEILFHLYHLNSKLISGLNKRLTYMSIPLTLPNLIPHIYSESPSLPSFLVYWGIATIQGRYETSYMRQRNMPMPLNGKLTDQMFIKHLRKAISDFVEKDGNRKLNGFSAKARISHLIDQLHCSVADLGKAWEFVEDTFGNYENLSEPFQSALSDAANFHMHESHFQNNDLSQFLARGPLYEFGSRIVHFGWRIKKAGCTHIGQIIIRAGHFCIKTGNFIARAYLWLFRFTPFYKAPFLHFLWMSTGVDPWLLIQNYILDIPLDPHVNPIFKKGIDNSMGAAFVGIDLLPAQGHLYFIEGNFNAGHYVERHHLTPTGDTVCTHLLDWANTCGYSKIHFYPSNFDKSFSMDLEKLWNSMAKRRAVEINIIDDPYIGSPWPRMRGFVNYLDRCKILINGRYIRSPISDLISGKGNLEREIHKHNANAPRQNQILAPREILTEGDLPDPDLHPLLPNLIIKDIRVDEGQGIYLYKTRTLPDYAHLKWHNSYEFVPPDFYETTVNGSLQRFAYLFRAYLLITPEGPYYMGARKDVSAVAIPDSLPFGMVKDKSMFATNLNLGAYSVPHSASEDKACREAIVAIGNVIFRFLQNKYKLCKTLKPKEIS